MDMHHIRYFLAVCETRNFTRAAERCNVTQPALSRAVQQLEEEVGGLLFRRERSLTHLTDLGVLLRPRFQQILDELMGVRQEASRFLCLENANLKVGIMCTVGPRRFTGLLADFNRRQQGIQLQLVEGVPASLSRLLESGEIDVAIIKANMLLGFELMRTKNYADQGIGCIDDKKMCGSVDIVNTYMGLPRKVECKDVYAKDFFTKVAMPLPVK